MEEIYFMAETEGVQTNSVSSGQKAAVSPAFYDTVEAAGIQEVFGTSEVSGTSGSSDTEEDTLDIDSNVLYDVGEYFMY